MQHLLKNVQFIQLPSVPVAFKMNHPPNLPHLPTGAPNRETVSYVQLSCDMMVCCGMNTLSNGTAWPCLWACRAYYNNKGIELTVLHVAGSLVSTE